MSPTLNQSTETNLKMMQMLEAAVVKDVKVAIVCILKYIKTNVLIVIEKIETLVKIKIIKRKF